jgi:hypothetical protein
MARPHLKHVSFPLSPTSLGDSVLSTNLMADLGRAWGGVGASSERGLGQLHGAHGGVPLGDRAAPRGLRPAPPPRLLPRPWRVRRRGGRAHVAEAHGRGGMADARVRARKRRSDDDVAAMSCVLGGGVRNSLASGLAVCSSLVRPSPWRRHGAAAGHLVGRAPTVAAPRSRWLRPALPLQEARHGRSLAAWPW